MCDSILYDCFVFCRLAEKKTDDILDNPNKSDGKQSQEEVDETVTKRKFFLFLRIALHLYSLWRLLQK